MKIQILLCQFLLCCSSFVSKAENEIPSDRLKQYESRLENLKDDYGLTGYGIRSKLSENFDISNSAKVRIDHLFGLNLKLLDILGNIINGEKHEGLFTVSSPDESEENPVDGDDEDEGENGGDDGENSGEDDEDEENQNAEGDDENEGGEDENADNGEDEEKIIPSDLIISGTMPISDSMILENDAILQPMTGGEIQSVLDEEDADTGDSDRIFRNLRDSKDILGDFGDDEDSSDRTRHRRRRDISRDGEQFDEDHFTEDEDEEGFVDDEASDARLSGRRQRSGNSSRAGSRTPKNSRISDDDITDANQENDRMGDVEDEEDVYRDNTNGREKAESEDASDEDDASSETASQSEDDEENANFDENETYSRSRRNNRRDDETDEEDQNYKSASRENFPRNANRQLNEDQTEFGLPSVASDTVYWNSDGYAYQGEDVSSVQASGSEGVLPRTTGSAAQDLIRVRDVNGRIVLKRVSPNLSIKDF